MFLSGGLVMKVYLLDHSHDNDTKLIGVFSSRETAECAITKYLEKPGFQDYPDGFRIVEYEIDKAFWEEGFIIS